MYDDCNFISVDWEKLAAGPNYFAAADNVDAVGVRTASLVDFLVLEGGADLDQFHLIGFSLGAHVVGKAGQKMTVGSIPRITGNRCVHTQSAPVARTPPLKSAYLFLSFFFSKII